MKKTKKDSFLSKIENTVLSFLKKFGLVIATVFGVFTSFIIIKKVNHQIQIKDEKKKDKIKEEIKTIETKTEEAKQEVSDIKEEVKEDIKETEEKIEEAKDDNDKYIKEQQKKAKKAGFKKKNK
jgi:F0F1-type ATP synthase membrane subunit b/b'